MAFDSLTEKLQNVFKNLRSKGRLTEDDVKAALREVKMALLEADVNFKVVKNFVKSVQERAVGQDVPFAGMAFDGGDTAGVVADAYDVAAFGEDVQGPLLRSGDIHYV